MASLLPQAQAYGYALGMLLLDEVESHVPGDTAHAGTYPYPVLFEVVTGASAARITNGDPTATGAVVEAAAKLARMGVKGITSNCGFMVCYQKAVASAVGVPVALSSLLQIPLACQAIGPDGRLGILTAFTSRLNQSVLALAGLPAQQKIAIDSIEDTEDWARLATHAIDEARFGAHLLARAKRMVASHPDVKAILLECALYPPYAPLIQRELGLPVWDFVSLVDHLYAVTHRRAPFHH
ncbi:MAG: hypothetical protein U1F33_11275 [Alphaproteobacteria bacterium]